MVREERKEIDFEVEYVFELVEVPANRDPNAESFYSKIVNCPGKRYDRNREIEFTSLAD